MNIEKEEITLLNYNHVFSNNNISIIKTIGRKSAVTDYAILLGAQLVKDMYVTYDNSLKGRTAWYFLSTSYNKNVCIVFYETGRNSWDFASNRNGGIRPLIKLSNKCINTTHLIEITFGEYPQYVVSTELNKILEDLHLRNEIKETGKTYTYDSRTNNEKNLPFRKNENIEYIYNDKKYVRVKVKTNVHLSNGINYKEGDYVWIEVSPLGWYLDLTERLLLSKNIVASGIRFCNDDTYEYNFENTEMYAFLNNYFINEIVTNKSHKVLSYIKRGE